MKIVTKQEYFMVVNDIENNGMLYVLENDEEKELHFPFMIFVPNECIEEPDVIFSCATPNNQLGVTLEEAILNTYKKNMKFSYVGRRLSAKYRLPIVTPIIPKIPGFDAPYLGSAIYHNDFSQTKKYIEEGICKIAEKDLDKFRNIHEQMCIMIEESLKFLKSLNYSPKEKVILEGYSASSKFVNYFTALHPELVSMCIAGGIAGLIISPLKEYNGYTLNYPVGVADLPDFDLESFKQVKHFYYIGASDKNDIAMPKCELDVEKCDEVGNVIPLLDKEGNPIYITDADGNYEVLYEDGYYTNYDINVINKGFSSNIQDRFDLLEEIYHQNGVDAVFKRYSGNHSTICKESGKALIEDIILEYEKNKSISHVSHKI